MTAKYTPGTKPPWVVNAPTRHYPSRVLVTAYDGQVVIYDVPRTNETIANGDLIAAAPDMFAALKRLTAGFALSGQCHETDCGCSQHEALAAIAKAEGRE